MGIERGGVDVHALAGLEQVDGDEAEQQREGGDDLEVEQGLGADTAYLFNVAHAGDTDDDGGEDDGRQRHADQFDEAVAEGLQGDGGMGKEHADHDAQGDARHDLQPERAEERGVFLSMAVWPCAIPPVGA